jgi:putative transcription antitermination factor YqgF
VNLEFGMKMKKERRENYLGIDWGSVNVGVAIADGETKVALAYITLKNNKDLLNSLGGIISKENITTVVIGILSYINRKEVEYDGEKLGKLMQKLFSVNVAYQNEMFTTKIAQARLIERGEKKVSKRDDAEAARIILQEWLDINEG